MEEYCPSRKEEKVARTRRQTQKKKNKGGKQGSKEKE
jgi:hypothetical protein